MLRSRRAGYLNRLPLFTSAVSHRRHYYPYFLLPTTNSESGLSGRAGEQATNTPMQQTTWAAALCAANFLLLVFSPRVVAEEKETEMENEEQTESRPCFRSLCRSQTRLPRRRSDLSIRWYHLHKDGVEMELDGRDKPSSSPGDVSVHLFGTKLESSEPVDIPSIETSTLLGTSRRPARVVRRRIFCSQLLAQSQLVILLVDLRRLQETAHLGASLHVCRFGVPLLLLLLHNE